MTTNLTLIVENRPGSLAGVTEALGHAGVNIDGVCCFVSQGIAILHLAVEQASQARREIERIGLKVYEERPVALVALADEPGAAAAALRRLADAGVNIDLAYLATETRIVIGSDNVDKVGAVIG